MIFLRFFSFLPRDYFFWKKKLLLFLLCLRPRTMAASPSPRTLRRPASLLSFVAVLLLLLVSCPLKAAEAQDSSQAARLASPTTPTTPSIPPLPRAEELCSLAKQYAVPLKLCSAEGNNGTLEIERSSLLAAVAAVGGATAAAPASPSPPSPSSQLPTSSTPVASPPPQSHDALRQQLDQATIQAASYLAPPLPGSPEALAAAAAERNATSAREKDFKSPRTRGWLIGSAVSVAAVSVLLVVLAGKKQKTGKWL